MDHHVALCLHARCAAGFEYTLCGVIAGGLKSVDGSTLQTDYTWSFQTPASSVVQIGFDTKVDRQQNNGKSYFDPQQILLGCVDNSKEVACQHNLAQEGRIELENFLVLEVKRIDRGEKTG